MDDIPYLLRGITQMTTASSTLISSSRYLNNPRMREWVAQELLRKNGPDLPTPSGAYQLSFIIKEMQNYAEIDIDQDNRNAGGAGGGGHLRRVALAQSLDFHPDETGSLGRREAVEQG